MSSKVVLKSANELIGEASSFSRALEDPRATVLLHSLYRKEGSIEQLAREFSWKRNIIVSLITSLRQHRLIEENEGHYRLTQLARKRLAYGASTWDFSAGHILTTDATSIPNPLRYTYKIKKRIGSGATSVTFCAQQSGTHKDRTLKIFLPGKISYDQLDRALKKRALIEDPALPELIEAGQLAIPLPSGEFEVVPCVALHYVNGKAKTFSQFLDDQNNLSPQIFSRFVLRVAGALKAIESVGLVHGDLHDGNILVVPQAGSAHEFWVIDFIGVPSVSSHHLDCRSDMENFRDHLLRAAVKACERNPGVSARLLLGEKTFRVLEQLRANSYSSFADLLRDFERPSKHIPSRYFEPPLEQPFEWLRAEWFPSPADLYRLFEPDQSRFQVIARFGNSWISGPRGCGKSHYLRVLAFHPDVIIRAKSDSVLAAKLRDLKYDFRKAFGVLFLCRLGEFKGFTPEALGAERFDPQTQLFLKHILTLKIINKTLITIREGLAADSDPAAAGNFPIIEAPSNYDSLTQFLAARFGSMAGVDHADDLGILNHLLSICTARENSAVSVWHVPERRQTERLLGERDLDEFFRTLKSTFPDLGQTRFYILVDDASYGHIHLEAQKVLNSLVRAVQAHHCFKITYDKYMYTSDTADGRAIDPKNEVTYIDLGEVSAKSQKDPAINSAKYMARVVDVRLKAAAYRLGIEEILGTSQNVKEFLTALSQPGSRYPKKGEVFEKRPRRLHAYYGGWNIISSLSHGSVRTLLELVEHIFRESTVENTTSSVSLKDQDKAVRGYSRRQFKSMSMLPGDYAGHPLGKKLQEVLSTVGEMSREYLQHYDTGDPDRWYETISMERLDSSTLGQNAQIVLDELVKYGLFFTEGLSFTRAQIGLSQRYDMNKIYAPAFQITYRVRNHIYLGRDRFEELLTKPDRFLRRHRTKLLDLAQIRQQGVLFHDNSDD